MDSFETLETIPTLQHFAAVQITRPVAASTLRSSSTTHESPINQTANTTKIAKLVFTSHTPKPVKLKAKTPIKNNQQQTQENSSIKLLLPSQLQVIPNEINDKKRDQSNVVVVRRREDIELEHNKATTTTVRREKEKKTLDLNLQAQSPTINKSKMDEATRCEARKFMKKQREKRKMEVKKEEVDKTFIIKQRLEELRLNTKNAITKKPKKSPLKISPPKDSNYYSLNNNKMKEIKVLKLKPMTAIKPVEKDNKTDEVNKTIEIVNESIEMNELEPLQPLNHIQLKKPSLTANAATINKENKKPILDDFKLKVPDVKLSKSFNQSVIINASIQPTIPFWMQNTNVQPYPYNFIWAVRKKLEAFTTKYENEKLSKQQKQEQPRFEFETPQIKRDRRQNKGRKLPQVNQSDDEESETNAKSMEHEMHSEEANTISEISSIKSDVAKSASISFKSLSEDPFVGKKRESVNSAFDHTSFDKKFESIGDISPNTSEKRNNFLSSTKHAEMIFKHPEAPLAPQPLANLNDLDNNNKLSEEKEEEFRKMLLAFNKSLSHVVEVNHLLSNALVSKSSSVASSSTTKKEYSSSFEKNVESSNISEMIENLVNNQKQTMPAKSDTTSSIQTIIEDSNTVEDPPIVYQEQVQEQTSSTTKVTTTTTRTEIIHQNQLPKEEHEATLNESKLINMFKFSESETSFIEVNESVLNTSAIDHINKSTSEIKSWERSLIERTRGQIAWLELQKINFKKHGNKEKVSAVKKQQRAILLRLEKERMKLKESRKGEKVDDEDLVEKAVTKLESSVVNFTGNDSETRENIERVLQQREQHITHRRRKIEHLLNWQRRLDEEERKLKLMERDLLNANKIKLTKSPNKKSNDNDILNTSFEMVKSINKSLMMLENVEISHDNETVDVVGHKMNKLWHRLTGVAEEKFLPQEIYQLTKRDLAQFYEEAKETVLESDLKIFLETSQQVQQPRKPESSQSESDNEQVPPQQEEEDQQKIKDSPNDTMDSIANIETEEEYAGSYEPELEQEVTEEQSAETENDEELHQLLANQMKVFVEQKSSTPRALTDETFQVQRKSQQQEQQHETNKNDDNETEEGSLEKEIVEEQSPINTEPIDSIDLSAVDEDGTIIPERNSMQVTDMDEEDNGQMIEDISFPNLEISLNDESRGHDLSTITECTEYEQMSSEPISSEIITHASSTPTTSERLNSEIEQRLLSLNDSLEQVDQAFKKIPMMSVQSSATYSTDQDFIDSKMIEEFEKTEISSKSES
ncbi:hypothetical protein PVAND_013589 [Polypedilum vanderplanki]|uniref:Uncharacterized protein n=1 Tax=Polypedilum vanderplanki TaxID=319348 RepID=A0A9J6CPV6_POLVA|nr:hypothetical protein PVAND_013589 [Polypedilum vanderplanki]